MVHDSLPIRLRRRAFLGAAASAALASPFVGAQSSWPNKPVTVLVPFPPGGPPDVIARVLAVPMGEALGKTIVVENRPGASTSLASQAVARAAPDGYTIMATDMSMAVVPHILAKPGFDPLKDFKYLGRTALTVLTVVVTPGLPVKTAKELVELSKAKPGEIKIAHTGIGTPPHLGAVAFIQATGANLLLVPYRGAALAIGDVVGHPLQQEVVSSDLACYPVPSSGQQRAVEDQCGAAHLRF